MLQEEKQVLVDVNSKLIHSTAGKCPCSDLCSSLVAQGMTRVLLGESRIADSEALSLEFKRMDVKSTQRDPERNCDSSICVVRYVKTYG